MFNTRLETAKEKISDLEDTAEEIMQGEVPRDKEMGNMRLQDHRTESEKVQPISTKVPEGENTASEEIKYFKK